MMRQTFLQTMVGMHCLIFDRITNLSLYIRMNIKNSKSTGNE